MQVSCLFSRRPQLPVDRLCAFTVVSEDGLKKDMDSYWLYFSDDTFALFLHCFRVFGVAICIERLFTVCFLHE